MEILTVNLRALFVCSLLSCQANLSWASGYAMPASSFNLIKYLIMPNTTSSSPSQNPVTCLFSGVSLSWSRVFHTALSMCGHAWYKARRAGISWSWACPYENRLEIWCWISVQIGNGVLGFPDQKSSCQSFKIYPLVGEKLGRWFPDSVTRGEAIYSLNVSLRNVHVQKHSMFNC